MFIFVAWKLMKINADFILCEAGRIVKKINAEYAEPRDLWLSVNSRDLLFWYSTLLRFKVIFPFSFFFPWCSARVSLRVSSSFSPPRWLRAANFWERQIYSCTDQVAVANWVHFLQTFHVRPNWRWTFGFSRKTKK